MSSIEARIEAAIAGAGISGLPVVATLSFDTNGRTMMGVAPSELADLHRRHHLAACGSNCGTGPPELVRLHRESRHRIGPFRAILICQRTAAFTQFVNGAIHLDGTPELMARYACLALDSGARIIGGCCGTTPQHLRTMRLALSESHMREAKPDLAAIENEARRHFNWRNRAIAGRNEPRGRCGQGRDRQTHDQPPGCAAAEFIGRASRLRSSRDRPRRSWIPVFDDVADEMRVVNQHDGGDVARIRIEVEHIGALK